jgi:Kef-type K+ transport system membrane component KefB
MAGQVPLTSGAFLLALIAIFLGAKLFGALVERFGQPAVLGELLAGVLLGSSGLALVNPEANAIRMLSEVGVILLLFEIGLETELSKLLNVGPAALSVAIVGIAVPVGLGIAVGLGFGLSGPVAVFLGAALAATSVGITARVLADLGRLHDAESRIVLGAAVVDDILGLIILAIVSGFAAGAPPTAFGVARLVGVAIGFVVLAVVVGNLVVPKLVAWVDRAQAERGILFFSLVFAFFVSWLSGLAGLAPVVGAFAAGIVLGRIGATKTIESGVRELAHFFVPIFFVSVGAAVELRAFDPWTALGRKALAIGGALLVVGIVGKLVSGLAVRRVGVRKLVVGVGMIPRGEVGLIFAQIGLSSAILTPALYNAVALMVFGTTFVTPPILVRLLGRRPVPPMPPIEGVSGVADLLTNAPFDADRDGPDHGSESRGNLGS